MVSGNGSNFEAVAEAIALTLGYALYLGTIDTGKMLLISRLLPA
ncbi:MULTISPECIES: hypothetical protein [Cyanophyceae]|nr:hypothetical protein [Trichocoleus sp. FACHB-69]